MIARGLARPASVAAALSLTVAVVLFLALSTPAVQAASGSSASACVINPGHTADEIERAINGCGNGTPDDVTTVRFPANASYVLKDTIYVKDRHNMVIDGRGSTFKITTDGQTKPTLRRLNPKYARSYNGGNWMLLRGSNITLRNLTAVGSFEPAVKGEPRKLAAENRPEYLAKNAAGRTRYSEAMSNFGIYGTDGAYLENLTGKFPWGDTVTTATDRYVDNFYGEHGGAAGQGNYARNVLVKRVRAEGTSRMCFGLTSGVDMWVEDSSCKSAWYGATDQEIDNPDQPLMGVHFLRNTFEDFNLFGYLLPVAGTNTSDIDIRGNVFRTPPDSKCAAIIGMGGYPKIQAKIKDVTIENNTMVTYGTAIKLDSIAGGTVRNNRITTRTDGNDCGKASGKGSAVDVSARSTGVAVANNGPDAPGAGAPIPPADRDLRPDGSSKPARTAPAGDSVGAAKPDSSWPPPMWLWAVAGLAILGLLLAVIRSRRRGQGSASNPPAT